MVAAPRVPRLRRIPAAARRATGILRRSRASTPSAPVSTASPTTCERATPNRERTVRARSRRVARPAAPSDSPRRRVVSLFRAARRPASAACRSKSRPARSSGSSAPNGAGKTRSLSSCSGCSTPDSGRIEIDGGRPRRRQQERVARDSRVRPQHIALIDGTVAQNIAFGVAPADVDLERMLEAVRAAQLDRCSKRCLTALRRKSARTARD